jgi:hypothetical protein
MGQLRPFLKVADPMLEKLTPFSRSLTSTVPAVDAFLRQAQPAVTFLKPHNMDFASFFGSNGQAGPYRDAFGGAVRIFNHIDHQSLSAITPTAQAAINRLADAGAVVLGDFPRKRKNSYPAPGSALKPQEFSGKVPRVEARP